MWIAVLASLLIADASDRQTKLLPLPDGRPLVIELTIGNVRIEGWERPEVEITVERHAPTASQFSRLPVSIEEVPPGVVVRAVQTGDANDPAFRADVTVRLPRSATIERVHVLEGRISIANFNGRISADIRRGPIDGRSIAGTIRLETEIGSITLNDALLSPTGLLRLRTFNGDVKLTLSQRPSNARIMALALNGQIKSDIPLKTRDTWGPRWGEATIGKGEPLISIDIVTGVIEIRNP